MKRILLVVLGSALAGLLILEIAARLTAPDHPFLNPRYVEISQGFEEFDALVDDVGWAPGEPPVFYEEFLYGAPPWTTAHLTITDYYSARWTPDSVPLEDAAHVVWTFGGSTMENTETTDSLTIANVWARMFNEAIGPTHVKNLGTGGFLSSHELLKFQKMLREVPEEEHPTIAIFYDGYNDAVSGYQYGPGRLQEDLSLKLESLVERRDGMLWAYASSNLLARWSKLWDRTGKRFVDAVLFPLGEPDYENLDQTIRTYVSNVRMIEAICEAFEVRCFFVLQPLLFTKSPLSPIEQEALTNLEAHPRFGPHGVEFVRLFYDAAASALDQEESFVYAADVLDGDSTAFFYDIGHTGALASPQIGRAVGHLILERIEGTDLPIRSERGS